MNFLTLNGWAINVATFAETNQFVGGTDQPAMSGTLLLMRRAVKRQFSVKTTLMPQVDADTLRRVLSWQGHTWPWDVDFFSGRGIGPRTTGIGAFAPTPKFGASALDASSNTNLSYSIPDFSRASGLTLMGWATAPSSTTSLRTMCAVQSSSDNTCKMVIRYQTTGVVQGFFSQSTTTSTIVGPTIPAGGYHHIALTLDYKTQATALYFDGLQYNTGTWALGSALIASPGPGIWWGSDVSTLPWAGYIDDSVFLPWAASPGYINSVAGATTAHGTFPEVVVGGQFCSDSPLTCIPTGVTLQRTAYVAGSSGYQPAAGLLAFTLSEV